MLDSNEKRPLYLQLVDVLDALIQEQFDVDEKIPTEKELCEEYAVSRTTVRQALSELQRRGIIYRVQGGGSYVSPAQTSCANSLFDFRFESHCTVSPVNLICKETHIEQPTGATLLNLMQQFGVTRTSNITRIKTTYTSDDVIIAQDLLAINTDCLGLTNSIDAFELERLLSHVSNTLASAKETYSTRIVSSTHEPQAILVIERSAYDATGKLQVLLERAIYSNYVQYQNFGFIS